MKQLEFHMETCHLETEPLLSYKYSATPIDCVTLIKLEITSVLFLKGRVLPQSITTFTILA